MGAKIQTKKTTLVIVGWWNRRIFTPQWIINKAGLTKSKDIKIEMAVNNPELPKRYLFDNLYLQISDDKVIIGPQIDDLKIFPSIENLGLKILNTLQHTPLIAVGVNFKYVIDEPDEKWLSLFEGRDKNVLSDQSFEIKSSSIIRKVIEDDHEINITNTFTENGKIIIDFNFHYNSNENNQVIDYLSGKLKEYHKISNNLIDQFFK